MIRACVRCVIAAALSVAAGWLPLLSAETKPWQELRAESDVLFQQQRYAEAVAMAEAAVRQAEEEFGPEHLNVAASLNDLAGMYRALAKEAYVKYTETAPQLYQRALSICEQQLGPGDSTVATVLNNLAELYRVQGDLDQAEPLYEQSLAIFQKQLGSDHPIVNQILDTLVELRTTRAVKAQSQPLAELRQTLSLQPSGAAGQATPPQAPAKDQTESQYQWKLAALESTLGPNHATVAAMLGNLADFYKDQKRYAEAEPLYQRILKIEEAQYGPSHEKTVVTLHRLAEVYTAQGRWAEADQFYRRVIDSLEQLFGPAYPKLALVMEQYAVGLEANGNPKDAALIRRRAAKITAE